MINERDRDKAAFETIYGLLRLTRMSLELENVSVTSYRAKDAILAYLYGSSLPKFFGGHRGIVEVAIGPCRASPACTAGTLRSSSHAQAKEMQLLCGGN